AQLARPCHPLRCSGPRTGVAVFCIARCLLIGRLVPVVPALRQYMTAQPAVGKYRCAVRTPGPAQVHLAYAGICREPAMQEYKAVGLMPRSRGGGYIRASFTVDSAPVENNRRCTEYKIRGACYVAVRVILAAALTAGIQGILVAQQAAVADY